MKKLLDVISSAPKNKIEEECGRLLVGEHIFQIRERLKKNQEDFGKILGWDADTVDRVEHGEFDEPPGDKIIQVIEAVEQYKSETYDKSAFCKVQTRRTPLFTAKKSELFADTPPRVACKTTSTQDA